MAPLPPSPSNALSEESALALAQNTSLTPDERALLLAFVREAPLEFGPWRVWKKIFKILDARALSAEGNVEVEILSAALWRVDAFVPGARDHKWKKAVDAGEVRSYYPEATARSGTHHFRIGANNNVSWRCWEVRVSPLGAPQIKGKPDPTHETVWRSESDEYTGGYKNAKVEGDILSFEGLHRGTFKVDISDLDFVHIVGDGPSSATWGYLKRRARRLMRKLLAQDPEKYWQVLEAFAREGAQTSNTSEQRDLSLAWSWLGDDLFLGRSPRLLQKRRGRGPIEVQGRLFWRRARLERAPKIWDAHREEARALLLDARTLPEASAVAFNVLRDGGEKTSDLLGAMSESALSRWAQGQVAWARALAFGELARRWSQSPQSPPNGEAAARLLIEAGARTRRAAQVLVEGALLSASTEWKSAFSRLLLGHLETAPFVADVALDVATWPRRARTAARALFALMREQISRDAFWKYLPLWAQFAREDESGAAEGNAWIESQVVESARRGDIERLADLARVGEEDRARLSEAFVRGAAGAKIGLKKAEALLCDHNASTTRLAWRLIEACELVYTPEKKGLKALNPIQAVLSESNSMSEGLRALFKGLYGRYWGNDEMGRAIYGDEAARLWARAAWSAEDLQEWITGAAGGYNWNSPWVRVLPHASGSFFLSVLDALQSRLGSKLGGADVVRARYGFRAIAFLPLDAQEQVLAEVSPSARSFAPTSEDLRLSFTAPQNYYMTIKGHSAAWRLLALTQASSVVLLGEWHALFSLPIEREASAAAIALWKRAQIDEAYVSPWLAQKDITGFAPDFLAFLLRRHPGLLIETLARASDEQTRALQVLVRDILRDESQRQSFWEGLWPRLPDELLLPVIQSRLLEDAEIFGSFARLSKSVVADLFSKGRDEAEPLLVSWLEANEDSLQREDEALLQAAISPLPAVHGRSIERLERLGLSLPLALRLWESLLPPAISAARRWADSRAPNSEEEAEVALALSDSPSPEVQEAGRKYLEARAERLLSPAMLARLSENTNPTMQAWVAGLLLQQEPIATEVETTAPSEFDRTVLRGKGRARAAKEKVKARLATGESEALEPSVLLEMARGRVARDREWALQQLARLAQNGIEVAGVQVLEGK